MTLVSSPLLHCFALVSCKSADALIHNQIWWAVHRKSSSWKKLAIVKRARSQQTCPLLNGCSSIGPAFNVWLRNCSYLFSKSLPVRRKASIKIFRGLRPCSHVSVDFRMIGFPSSSHEHEGSPTTQLFKNALRLGNFLKSGWTTGNFRRRWHSSIWSYGERKCFTPTSGAHNDGVLLHTLKTNWFLSYPGFL